MIYFNTINYEYNEIKKENEFKVIGSIMINLSDIYLRAELDNNPSTKYFVCNKYTGQNYMVFENTFNRIKDELGLPNE